MSIEGQGHFFTIYFPGFGCFLLYLAKVSGERLQDQWNSGFYEGADVVVYDIKWWRNQDSLEGHHTKVLSVLPPFLTVSSVISP